MRGKYMSKSKFLSAAKGGFGFVSTSVRIEAGLWARGKMTLSAELQGSGGPVAPEERADEQTRGAGIAEE